MEICFCRAWRGSHGDQYLAHKLLTLFIASTAWRFGVVVGLEMRALA